MQFLDIRPQLTVFWLVKWWESRTWQRPNPKNQPCTWSGARAMLSGVPNNYHGESLKLLRVSQVEAGGVFRGNPPIANMVTRDTPYWIQRGLKELMLNKCDFGTLLVRFCCRLSDLCELGPRSTKQLLFFEMEIIMPQNCWGALLNHIIWFHPQLNEQTLVQIFILDVNLRTRMN